MADQKCGRCGLDYLEGRVCSGSGFTLPCSVADSTAREIAERLRAHAVWLGKHLDYMDDEIAMLNEAATALADADALGPNGCPCANEGVEACSRSCTCRKPHMSGGCLRCARYGSAEQRLNAAKRLVSLADAEARVRQAEVYPNSDRGLLEMTGLQKASLPLLRGIQEAAFRAGREDASVALSARLAAVEQAARNLLAFIREKYPQDFVEGGRGYTCEHHRALSAALGDPQ